MADRNSACAAWNTALLQGHCFVSSTIVLIVKLCDNLAYDDDTNDVIDITEAVRFDTNIPLSFPDRLHHIGVVAAIWVKRTKQLRFVLYRVFQ